MTLAPAPPDLDTSGSAPGRVKPTSVPAGGRTPRWPLALVGAGFVALCLAQSPGRIVADTKLPLVLNPSGFLGSALHFWDSGSDFGFLPNQYVGYLFPMGPFFLAGHLLGVAPWITERLWWALLLTLGAWGVTRVTDALGVGRPFARVTAGMAYAVSPIFFGMIASTSVALTGAAMLPWMVTSLLRCEVAAVAVTGRAPEAFGRRSVSPRRAAALCGLAIAATGGVNATVTLCVLCGPAVLLLLAGNSRAAWALRGWWLVAVLFATLWWILPLGLQGRYGLNFLAYTETAQVTTSFAAASEVLRGTANWLAYLRLPSPWVRAGYTYVTAPAAIAGPTAVTALGLWGLAWVPGAGVAARLHPRTRRLLAVTLAVGVLAAGSAYPGDLHSPFAGGIQDLLGGSLGFLRNIYKFEPVVWLPLSIGLAHTLTAMPGALPRREKSRRVRLRRLHPGRAVAALVALAAIVATATPALAGHLAPTGSFTKVPAYWSAAADWLADNPDGGRTLVLPGSAFGEYDWGRPMDEPLLWLARTPWGVRNLIPLGGAGVTRYLDGIEQELALGTAPGLATALTRAGIGQVLVRNDLVDRQWDAPPSTSQITRALNGSGLVRAASFGPLVAAREPSGAAPTSATGPAGRAAPAPKVPALVVWKVPAGASRVSAYPAAATTVVSGGPEATVELAARGLLGPGPTVLASDLAAATASLLGPPTTGPETTTQPTVTWADTDTLTRRDVSFGLVHGGGSYLLGPHEDVAGSATPPSQRLDTPPGDHQTVAGYRGIASVTASSYGFALSGAPSLEPAAALDGDPGTYWQARVGPDGSVGAWLRVDVGREITARTLTVRLVEEGSWRPAVHAIRVTTERGSVVTGVRPDETAQVLAVPAGPTRWFQVSFASVTRQTSPLLGAGIRELTIPGVTATRYAQAPSDAAPLFAAPGSGRVEYAFDRYRSDPTVPFAGDEEQQLHRGFVVPRAMTFAVTGSAVPLPAPVGQPRAARHGPLALGCGSGPTVTVDGHGYQTRITGRLESLTTLAPMTLTLCTPGGRLTLRPGEHLLTTAQNSSAVTVSGLTLTDAAARPPAVPARATTVASWSAERRQVTVGPGARSVLVVHEDFNASWTARLDGVALAPIRVDGWQQGFVVPAGAGGTVALTNAPGLTYRRDLLIGLGLVVALLALALVRAWPVPRRRSRPGPDPAVPPDAASTVVAGGTAGPDSAGGRAAVIGRLGWVAAATLAVALVAGPVALAVPPLALLTWWYPQALGWLAAAGAGTAGTFAAIAPGRPPATGQGAFSPVAQAAAALAVGCVLLALGRDGARRGPPAIPATPVTGDDQ
jgi:arabinofuranan 3-O-arabinosyltransferase